MLMIGTSRRLFMELHEPLSATVEKHMLSSSLTITSMPADKYPGVCRLVFGSVQEMGEWLYALVNQCVQHGYDPFGPEELPNDCQQKREEG